MALLHRCSLDADSNDFDFGEKQSCFLEVDSMLLAQEKEIRIAYVVEEESKKSNEMFKRSTQGISWKNT